MGFTFLKRKKTSFRMSSLYYQKQILQLFNLFFRSNPRTVSIGHLNTLLYLQLQPINLIVSKGSYSFRMGNLILWSASRLDAFSVYQIQTWLLCYAFGKTTDAPVVRPSRSSRTKDSSTQISCAHDG